MYPARELTRLAARKAALRRVIALRRIELTDTAVRVTAPLRWLDQGLALVRRLPPVLLVAAVPLGCLLARSWLARLTKAGLLASGVVRATRRAVALWDGVARFSGRP